MRASLSCDPTVVLVLVPPLVDMSIGWRACNKVIVYRATSIVTLLQPGTNYYYCKNDPTQK